MNLVTWTDEYTKVVIVLMPALVMIGVVVASVLRWRHKKKKADERKCRVRIRGSEYKSKCNRKTVRYYQMLRSKQLSEKWWNWCFQFTIIDVCGCHARVIPPGSVVKLFTVDELLWRLLTNWGQFNRIDWVWELVEQTDKMIQSYETHHDRVCIHGHNHLDEPPKAELM